MRARQVLIPDRLFIRMRYQQGVEDQVTLVSGEMPSPQDPIVMLEGFECPEPGSEEEEEFVVDPEDEIDCEEEEVPLHQVAVTAATLAQMLAEVGDRMIITPDFTDSLYRGRVSVDLDFRMVLEISGVIELTPLSDPFWFDDHSLHEPRIAQNPDFVFVYAAGLMSPADQGRIVRDMGLIPWNNTYRLTVDPQLIDPLELDLLQADLRGLEVTFSTFDSDPHAYKLSTGLTGLIDEHVAQRRLAISMLSISLAGVFAMALAMVLLLAALIEVRRRSATVLLRNRGASRRQMILSRIIQGFVVAAPGAALGYVRRHRPRSRCRTVASPTRGGISHGGRGNRCCGGRTAPDSPGPRIVAKRRISGCGGIESALGAGWSDHGGDDRGCDRDPPARYGRAGDQPGVVRCSGGTCPCPARAGSRAADTAVVCLPGASGVLGKFAATRPGAVRGVAAGHSPGGRRADVAGGDPGGGWCRDLLFNRSVLDQRRSARFDVAGGWRCLPDHR